jgi:hypothetical protein
MTTRVVIPVYYGRLIAKIMVLYIIYIIIIERRKHLQSWHSRPLGPVETCPFIPQLQFSDSECIRANQVGKVRTSDAAQ